MSDRPEPEQDTAGREVKLYCPIAMERGHVLECPCRGCGYDCAHCHALQALKKGELK